MPHTARRTSHMFELQWVLLNISINSIGRVRVVSMHRALFTLRTTVVHTSIVHRPLFTLCNNKSTISHIDCDAYCIRMVYSRVCHAWIRFTKIFQSWNNKISKILSTFVQFTPGIVTFSVNKWFTGKLKWILWTLDNHHRRRSRHHVADGMPRS